MSKFLGKFSRKKLIATVSVLLIIAIGTPLLTRQYWVYDADSSKFDATSSTSGSDTLTEVPKDQLVKSKQYAQLMINYIKSQPASTDPEVMDQRFVELIKYSAIDQEINADGNLVITPIISYQGGIRFLSQLKNQVLVLTDGANDETKLSLNQITDEIDKSIKIFGNGDFKGDNQGATVKVEFLRLSAILGSKASPMSNSNAKGIIAEASLKLKAFPTDDTQYLTATQLYSESAQTQISMISNNLEMIKIAQKINLQFTLQDPTNTVSLKPANYPEEKNGFVNSAKAADSTPIINTGLKEIKVAVTQDVFNGWLTESKTTLARKDMNLDQMKTLIAGSAYDKFKLGTVNSETTKDQFVSANGSAFTAISTQDPETAWNIANRNIEAAAIWSSYYEGVHIPGQGSTIQCDPNYWTKLASAIKSNNPEAVNALIASANINPAWIFKWDDTDTNGYLDGIKQKLVQAPASDTAVVGDTTKIDPLAAQAINTDPVSIYNADGSFNETAQAAALLASTDLLVNQTTEVRDKYKALLTGTTEINGKQVPNDQVIAQNNNAIKALIRNNLTDTYFGTLYLNYLRTNIPPQELDIYTERLSFCTHYGSALTTNVQLADTKSRCDEWTSQFNSLKKNQEGAIDSNVVRSEAKGSVSMDPRTGNMVYNTTAVFFDREGKPNIAGSMTFNPTTSEVSGNLTKAFGNSRVTLYSDAFTGDLYLEYSNLTKPLVQVGNILTLQTFSVSKEGKIGGTFTLFNRLLNYNPNTNQLELKLTSDSSPANLWVNTKGEVRGSYNFKVGNSGFSTGIIVDSKGNFTVPINYNAGGVAGSVFIGKNGDVSGQLDLGKVIGNTSIMVGFDKKGISSVGIPIGGIGIAGKLAPFSLSIGRDGGLSFGGFVPIAGLPVPIALGQDEHGNITLSWPGGHWNLGSENRPINAPVPAMKADDSGYDAGTIWYHHSFKKGWKVVRVYNKVEGILPSEQKTRGETIFKEYNELLKRNPSISEFLNYYFYSGHEMFDKGLVEQMNNGGEQKRNELLASSLNWAIKHGYSKVVPENARFSNPAEYKWLQDGKKSADFPERSADILDINPFDSDVIAKAQVAANNPTNANIASLTATNGATSTSMSQITTAITSSINQDSDYAKVMRQFQLYFNPSAAAPTSSADTGFVAGPTITNANTNATNTNTNK